MGREQLAELETEGDFRELPKSIEAEQQVLGAILLDPQNAIADVVDRLKPEDFYLQRHRVIYRTMCALFLESVPPDVITVSNRLQERGETERAGGRIYLNELQDRSVTSAALEHHADIVRKKAVLRSLIDVGGRLIELGHDEVSKPQDLLDQAVGMVLEPSLSLTTTEVEHVGDFADDYLKRVDASVSGKAGMSCGYSTLDSVLYDVRGQLMVIAGLPHMGKTVLGLNMLYRQVVRDVPCGILSLEMTKFNVLERLIQMEGRLTRSRVRYEPGLRRAALKELCKRPIFVAEVRPKSLASVLRQMRVMVHQDGVQALLVDYIQLVDPPQADRNDIAIGMVVRSLLEFAQAHDVFVVSPSQANRDTISGGIMPNLWNMKNSAEIEAHSDIILGISRPSYLSEAEVPATEPFDVRTLKQRAGVSGRKYRFTFFPGIQRIEERTPDGAASEEEA